MCTVRLQVDPGISNKGERKPGEPEEANGHKVLNPHKAVESSKRDRSDETANLEQADDNPAKKIKLDAASLKASSQDDAEDKVILISLFDSA